MGLRPFNLFRMVLLLWYLWNNIREMELHGYLIPGASSRLRVLLDLGRFGILGGWSSWIRWGTPIAHLSLQALSASPCMAIYSLFPWTHYLISASQLFLLTFCLFILMLPLFARTELHGWEEVSQDQLKFLRQVIS